MINAATPIAFSDPLPDAVDVVVIGAGIVGTATAWFLARDGLRVLLCEKGRGRGAIEPQLGVGSPAGPRSCRAPIMIESNRLWRGLAAQTGEADLTLTTTGCLYLAQTPMELAKLEEWHEVARQHQLDTRMLSAAGAAAAAEGVEGTWTGGMLTPSDGRAEPFVAVPALARDAHRRGVSILEDCAVRTVESAAGRVSAVVTERGRVRAEAVVIAAGSWSSIFAGNLGLDLPQLMVRSTVGRTHPVDGPDVPNLSAPGFAVRRRRDGGYTVASGDLVEHYLSRRSFRDFTKFLPLLRAAGRDVRVRLGLPSGYPGAWGEPSTWSADDDSPFERMRVLDPEPSPVVSGRIERALRRRAPWLAEAGIAEIWAGMIDVTPDAVPYLCEIPERRGLFLGTGMSGHGFGFGPGAGRVLADLVQARSPGHDLTRFRFDRFTDGSPIVPGPY